MKVTTIKEAKSRCKACRGRGYVTEIFEPYDRNDCGKCNGTGRTCGTALSKEEVHTFAIIEAARALMALNAGPDVATLLDLCGLAIRATGEFAKDSIDRAERAALYPRAMKAEAIPGIDLRQLSRDFLSMPTFGQIIEEGPTPAPWSAIRSVSSDGACLNGKLSVARGHAPPCGCAECMEADNDE